MLDAVLLCHLPRSAEHRLLSSINASPLRKERTKVGAELSSITGANYGFRETFLVGITFPAWWELGNCGGSRVAWESTQFQAELSYGPMFVRPAQTRARTTLFLL